MSNNYNKIPNGDALYGMMIEVNVIISNGTGDLDCLFPKPCLP